MKLQEGRALEPLFVCLLRFCRLVSPFSLTSFPLLLHFWQFPLQLFALIRRIVWASIRHWLADTPTKLSFSLFERHFCDLLSAKFLRELSFHPHATGSTKWPGRPRWLLPKGNICSCQKILFSGSQEIFQWGSGRLWVFCNICRDIPCVRDDHPNSTLSPRWVSHNTNIWSSGDCFSVLPCPASFLSLWTVLFSAFWKTMGAALWLRGQWFGPCCSTGCMNPPARHRTRNRHALWYWDRYHRTVSSKIPAFCGSQKFHRLSVPTRFSACAFAFVGFCDNGSSTTSFLSIFKEYINLLHIRNAVKWLSILNL